MKRRGFLGTLLGACAALLPWRKAAPVDAADVVWSQSGAGLYFPQAVVIYGDAASEYILPTHAEIGHQFTIYNDTPCGPVRVYAGSEVIEVKECCQVMWSGEKWLVTQQT